MDGGTMMTLGVGVIEEPEGMSTIATIATDGGMTINVGGSVIRKPKNSSMVTTRATVVGMDVVLIRDPEDCRQREEGPGDWQCHF